MKNNQEKEINSNKIILNVTIVAQNKALLDGLGIINKVNS